MSHQEASDPDRRRPELGVRIALGAQSQQIIRLVRGESVASTSASKPLQQQVIFDAREEISNIETPESMERYIVAIIAATRRPADYSEKLERWIQVGASPRGSLALDKVSRAHAWLNNRSTVTPDDIRAIVHDCLRHRLILSYEARAEGIGPDEVVSTLLNNVAVE